MREREPTPQEIREHRESARAVRAGWSNTQRLQNRQLSGLALQTDLEDARMGITNAQFILDRLNAAHDGDGECQSGRDEGEDCG